MRGEILVGPVDAGLVAAGGGDPSLEIVADDQLRYTADEGERVDVGADPVRQALAPASLGIGVVRSPEHSDEDVRLAHLAGGAVDHRHGVAGEVDEQLLAGNVRLAHGGGDGSAPSDVEAAEPTVTVAVRMLGPVLLPEQHQGHAAPPKLGMDKGPVRLWAGRRRVEPGRREQTLLEVAVVQPGRDRPGDPDHGRPAQILGHRASADPDRLGDQPIAGPAGMLETKNFSDLAHRQSLSGHRHSLASLARSTVPVS